MGKLVDDAAHEQWIAACPIEQQRRKVARTTSQPSPLQAEPSDKLSMASRLRGSSSISRQHPCSDQFRRPAHEGSPFLLPHQRVGTSPESSGEPDPGGAPHGQASRWWRRRSSECPRASVSGGRPTRPPRALPSIRASCARAWPGREVPSVFRSSRVQSDGICGAQLGAAAEKIVFTAGPSCWPARRVTASINGRYGSPAPCWSRHWPWAILTGCAACNCSRKQLASALLPMPGSPVRKTSWRWPARAR